MAGLSEKASAAAATKIIHFRMRTSVVGKAGENRPVLGRRRWSAQAAAIRAV